MKNKVISKYGLIGGLLLSIFFLGPIVIFRDSYFDPDMMDTGQIFGYGVMILAMCCVFFGVRSARKKAAGNFGFGQALVIGLLITLVANILFYVANVILYEVIAPDFLQNFISFYHEHQLKDIPAGQREELQKQLELEAQAMTNGWIYGMIMTGTTIAIGIIISLVAAVVFGRRNKVA